MGIYSSCMLKLLSQRLSTLNPLCNFGIDEGLVRGVPEIILRLDYWMTGEV